MGIALIAVTPGPDAQSQKEFKRAHALLAELDHLQKSGQRDKATSERLTDLIAHVPQEVQNLINLGTVKFLSSQGPHSPTQLRLRISEALQIASPDQYQPEVFAFSVHYGQGNAYFVAYNVPYCASCSRAWIGLLAKKMGRYGIVAEADNVFANKSLHAARIAPSEDGEDRFAVYGTNLGDAHNRLSIVVYKADGAALKREWARIDLPQGTVELSRREITLKFLAKVEHQSTAERTEIYQIEPSGIRLKEQLEHPTRLVVPEAFGCELCSAENTT